MRVGRQAVWGVRLLLAKAVEVGLGGPARGVGAGRGPGRVRVLVVWWWAAAIFAMVSQVPPSAVIVACAT